MSSQRRRKRAKALQARNERNGDRQTDRRRADVPAEPFQTDTTKIRMIDVDEPKPAPPGDDGDSEAKSGYDASRGNATRSGRRSRTIFPEDMAVRIDDRFKEFRDEKKPETGLQRWCVYEMARSSVQIDVCDKDILLDMRRVLDRTEDSESWQMDATERAYRLAARLPRDPARVARALAETKQGASLLIYNLNGLADAIKSNGLLSDPQRELLFDLVGVPNVLRDGNRQVPAASDGPALSALLAKETRRLQWRLDNVLNARDEMERKWSNLGILNPNHRDATSRGLRGDLSRALRRLRWATQTLAELRSGAKGSTIIDPETGKPLDPEADAPAATKRKPAAAQPKPQPTPTPTPTPTASPTEAAPDRSSSSASAFASSDLPEFPERDPHEDKESLMKLAAGFREWKAMYETALAADSPAESEPAPSS